MSRKKTYRPTSYYYKLLSNKPDFLNVTETARLLCLCTKTLYHKIQNKQISAIQLGSKYLFPRQCILEFVKQNQPPERMEQKIYSYSFTSQTKAVLTRTEICELLRINPRTISMNKKDFPFRSIKNNIQYLYPLEWFIEDLRSLLTVGGADV